MMNIEFLDLENMGVDINFIEFELLVTELPENYDFQVMAALNYQHNMGYVIVVVN